MSAEDVAKVDQERTEIIALRLTPEQFGALPYERKIDYLDFLGDQKRAYLQARANAELVPEPEYDAELGAWR